MKKKRITAYPRKKRVRTKEDIQRIENERIRNMDITIKTKISTLSQWESTSRNLDYLNLQIDTLENDPTLTSVVVFDNFDQVKDKIVRRNELTQLKTDLDQKNIAISQLNESLMKLDVDYNTAVQDWEALVQKLGVCPTCKQPTKDVKF